MRLAGADDAAAKERQVYAPSSPWNMECADNSCSLSRSFTDGQHLVVAAFQRFAPGTNLRLASIGDGLDPHNSADTARFRFDPGGEERESAFYHAKLADGRDVSLVDTVSLISQEEADPDRAKNEQEVASLRIARVRKAEATAASSVSSMILTSGLRQEIELQLGSMAAPLKTMRACTADLAVSWGLDPQTLGTISRSPELLAPRKLAQSVHYPPAMLHEGGNARVGVRLVVDEQGRATSCRLDVAEAGPFEEAACTALLENARFKPALDAQGLPVRYFWSSRVLFRAS